MVINVPGHEHTTQTHRQTITQAQCYNQQEWNTPFTLSLLLSLTPSMRSVKTAWLRLLCSFSCVQPTVRFSMARANRSSTSYTACTTTAAGGSMPWGDLQAACCARPHSVLL